MEPLKDPKFRATPPVARSAEEFRTIPHLRTLFQKRALLDSVEAADAVAAYGLGAFVATVACV